MSDNRKRIIAGLAAAAGALGAYYAVRAMINMQERREYDAAYYARFVNRVRNQPGVQVEGLPGVGTRYQPHTQPDRAPIPTTGEAVMAYTAKPVMADTAPAYIEQSVMADDLASPLAQYLITFYDMIHQLRIRRWSDPSDAGIILQRHSLTPQDRVHFDDELERLAEQMPDISEDSLPDGTPQQRMYRLFVKVRDALQNPDYSDDDLFRINGQVRTEACQVLDEIRVAGEDITQARRLYECG